MAKQSTLRGVSIVIHSEQGVPRNKPHVHARYCEYEASIDLEGNVLTGKLPPKKLNATIQWIRANQQKLYAE